jgi:hypothetical protein
MFKCNPLELKTFYILQKCNLKYSFYKIGICCWSVHKILEIECLNVIFFNRLVYLMVIDTKGIKSITK